MENEVLPPEKKYYHLHNPTTINHNYRRDNRRSMGWNNLIVVPHALHSVEKYSVNVISYIYILVEPTPTTNIITKKKPSLSSTVLNRDSKFFVKRLGCSTKRVASVP